MVKFTNTEMLIKKLFPYDVVDKKSYAINAQAVYESILNSSTEDVIKVVKCKNCIHYREIEGYEYHNRKAKICVWHNSLRSENDFCSDGISVADKNTDIPT